MLVVTPRLPRRQQKERGPGGTEADPSTETHRQGWDRKKKEFFFFWYLELNAEGLNHQATFPVLLISFFF